MPGDEPNVQLPSRGDRIERRRAVVIGVDDYPDPRLRLPYCSADAGRVAELLRGRGFEVTAVVTPPAGSAAPPPTRARVVEALDAITAASDADDLVVVYVACHGKRIERRPYLLLADTTGDEAGIAAGGLALGTLLERLRGPARWVAVFLDVCQVGLGLDPTVGRSLVHGEERAGGFALLAGSTSRGISQDTVGGGVFTRSLVDGLAGAAADPDGGLRLSSLARHVQEGVARWRRSPEGKLKASSQRSVLRLEVADFQIFPPRDYIELSPMPAGACACATFGHDGLALITGHDDGSVQIWDARSGRAVFAPMAHGAPVAALAVSLAGFISSGSGDGVVKNWRLSDGDALPPDNQFPAAIHGLGWTDTGMGRIVAAGDGVRIQHVKHIVLQRIVDRIGEEDSRSLAVFGGGFVTGGADGALRWWSGAGNTAAAIGALPGPVRAVAASADGQRVVATAGDRARLWDLATGTEVELAARDVVAVAFSPAGDRVAVGSTDGVVRIFDAPAASAGRELTVDAPGAAPRPAVRVVCFAPSGDRLFVGHADGRARLWKL